MPPDKPGRAPLQRTPAAPAPRTAPRRERPGTRHRQSGRAPGASASGEAPAGEDPAGAADDRGAAGQAAPGGRDAADDQDGALRELSAAACRALAAGDPSAALAEISVIRAAAAESTRLIKAAAAGRASLATRPGGLRDLVDAHLRAHPGTDFSAGQIGKVLGRSAGAVANALDRLTTVKRAGLTCESPRRYQATPAGR